MNITKDNRAFTVLELMFVIVIISILVSGVTPYFMKSLENARNITNEANLKILNTAVNYFKHTESEKYNSIYESFSNNGERLNYLKENNYIDNVPEAQGKNLLFVWEINSEKWILGNRESYTDEDPFLLEENSKILFPVKEKLYKVKVVLKNGGILIDYIANKDTDSLQGFVLQFDEKNKGSIVLKEIKNNNSSRAVVGYTFNYYNSYIIPENNSDTGKEWWSSFHEVSIIVKDNRSLSVLIDEEVLFRDFLLPQRPEGSEVYTGIWSGDKKVLVKKIDISY